jgi:hypothetical protein
MTTGTNLGRAGSPLPAALPHNDCGTHGVTRPTHVPIPTGNWYKIPTFSPLYQVCGRLYRLEPMAENALFLSQIVKKKHWHSVEHHALLYLSKVTNKQNSGRSL